MAIPSHTPDDTAVEPDITNPDRLEGHRRGTWRFLRFLGAEPGLADDLTQEVFLRLCAAPFRDRGDAALASWLRQTAHNLFRAAGRQLRRELVALDPQEVDHAWARLTESDPSADAHRAALDRCVEELEDRARTVLGWRHGEGIDRAVIAHRLGMSVEGVKSLLRRARERLRVCLRRRLEEDR